MEKSLFIIYNKPKGIICTTEKIEDNVLDAIDSPVPVLPVGRLDKDSEGLLLLTNQKDAINKIIHPDFEHEKEYLVTLNLPLRNQFLKEMAAGVNIGDAITKPCKIWAEKGTKRVFRIVLKQGLNRQIRRMCAVFNYQVIQLKRVRLMHLELGKLPVGAWRVLSDEELEELRQKLG